MRNNLSGLAAIIAGSAVLLVGLLIAMTLSSPGGNPGDGAIIALPVLFILVITTPIGFVTALIYLIKERPRGKAVILPIAVLIMPLVMITSVYAYGEFKHRWGVISADEAIALVKECKVNSMQGDNHKRWKLSFYEKQADSVWISSKDRMQVQIEIVKSRSYCKT